MTTPKLIRVHIGAHKTATTHFQDTLAKMSTALSEQNIIFLERDTYRPLIRKLARGKLLKKNRFSFTRKRALKNALMENCNKKSTLLISEENILGDCIHLCDADPFPYIDFTFLRTLASIAPTEIYLSIRSFDSVLSGAYCTALKYHPRQALTAKAVLIDNATKNNIPSWIPLIKRIKQALPDVTLRIWTQEDYRQSSCDIIRAFVGLETVTIPDIERPAETITPTNQGVEKVENLISSGDQLVASEQWERVCNETFLQYKAVHDDEKFSFFDVLNKKIVQQAYQAEIKKISELWPDILVR